MNLILFNPAELDRDTISFSDHRADHIRKVLKSVPGDTLRIGILNGPMGHGTIVEIQKNHVTLKLNKLDTIPAKPPVDLILALPRPIMLKRVLAQAASLGVGRIFLVNARRVEKSFFNATLMKENNFLSSLQQGLEQAIDTRMPEISIHTRFKPFVEDLLPTIIRDCPVGLVAHPASQRYIFEQTPSPLTDRVLLAIGPEGGWVDFEIDKFTEQGLLAFSLGPRILRVDTAVPALMAQLDLIRLMSGITHAATVRQSFRLSRQAP